MATALVLNLHALPEPATAGGMELTYNVAFSLDNGKIDFELVTIVIAAGDTANVINGKMSSAISSLATSRGYSVAKTAITTIPYGKG